MASCIDSDDVSLLTSRVSAITAASICIYSYKIKLIMFSGIVEESAKVLEIKHDRENIDFTLTCSFVSELGIDQSVAHNGVCLTVVRLLDKEGNQVEPYSPQAYAYVVTAMKETIDRSNLGDLHPGSQVNVERSMMMNGRLDGHIVQGHVDQTAECTSIVDQDGSYTFRFAYACDREMARRGYITVDKGSVTVNGVSLTVCNPTDDSFEVNIIPYTFENTNFNEISIGSRVNLEFDIIGKYIARISSFA